MEMEDGVPGHRLSRVFGTHTVRTPSDQHGCTFRQVQGPRGQRRTGERRRSPRSTCWCSASGLTLVACGSAGFGHVAPLPSSAKERMSRTFAPLVQHAVSVLSPVGTSHLWPTVVDIACAAAGVRAGAAYVYAAVLTAAARGPVGASASDRIRRAASAAAMVPAAADPATIAHASGPMGVQPKN